MMIAAEMNQAIRLSVDRPTGPAKRYVQSAGIILLFTGIAKIWSSFGNTKLLAVTDPILGISFDRLMLLVGTLEIGIALVCLVSSRQFLTTALIAWLATSFLVYRVGLWWMDWKRPCGCLGNLTDALYISPQTADNIMKVVLAYLLIGSYGLLVWRSNPNQETERASPRQ